MSLLDEALGRRGALDEDADVSVAPIAGVADDLDVEPVAELGPHVVAVTICRIDDGERLVLADAGLACECGGDVVRAGLLEEDAVVGEAAYGLGGA